MKFLRFKRNEVYHYGVLTEKEKVLDLSSFLENFPKPLDDSTVFNLTLLAYFENSLRTTPHEKLEKHLVNLNEVKLVAPLAAPPKIICLGLNYRDHARGA